MVLQKESGFCEQQNTMDLFEQKTCFKNAIKSSMAAIKNTELSEHDICHVAEDQVEGKSVETLQSAFLKFKKTRQNKLQQLALTQKRLKQDARSEEQINELREKFVEQAKSYLGVPYARRYHEPGSPEHDAPLFLDCCGLVRKILRDMKEDFGFSIGPWNQAYMFDTLPNIIQDVHDMKPGDLVFVSGTFFSPKKRKQRHDMVHVEIWAGDGEKTIGARWQKGKVQIHDSYQFVSKSYCNMVYHFKSIDTWLNGTCRSFCSQHPWKSSVYVPGERSIFSTQEADEPADDCGDQQLITETENCEGKLFAGNFLEDEVKKNGGERWVEKVIDSVCVERRTREDQRIVYEPEKGIACEWEIPYLEKETTGENVLAISKAEAKCYGEKSGTQKVSARCEEIVLEDACFEDACFCNLCISDADVLAFGNGESESERLEILHRNANQMTKTEVSDDASNFNGIEEDRSASTETVEQRRHFRVAYTSDGVPVDHVFGTAAQVASRPNTGGTGAGGTRKQRLTTQTASGRGKGGTRRRGNGDDDQSNDPREPSRPLCRPNPSFTKLHQRAPTFFIGGHNGTKMVEATLSSLGWNRIYDKNDTSFYLKWVECKRNLDFSSFREGEQLVNHIPNGNLLTTKIGLLTSLQEFERVSSKVASPNRRGVLMKDFVPETYKLQNQTEIDNFIHHIYQESEMWICKPTGMNQGKGIYLIRSRDELLEKLGPKIPSQGRQRCFPSAGRVVQRYILNPFLLNGYKADIRTYMLIAGTCPYMVFYHPGYVRLSLVPYSLSQEEVHAHLTNQYIQKKHPLYEQVKEETVWSLEQLQEYINKTSNTLPPDWVSTTFTKRMQEIMLHCFQSVRYKLNRKVGYFDLLGFDFMLDENFKVWLIEINVNPALHTNCKILSGLIPELVDSTLKLVVEVFEKGKRGEKVVPLENLGKFQLIFSDEKK